MEMKLRMACVCVCVISRLIDSKTMTMAWIPKNNVAANNEYDDEFF